MNAYDRWRPALFSIAVLLSVVAVAVLNGEGSDQSTSPTTTADVSVSTTTIPKVPLDRRLKEGVKGDDVLRLQ